MGSEFCIIEQACCYCINDEDACNFETYWWWGFDPQINLWYAYLRGLGIYPSKFKYIWQELDSILSWRTNILVILGIGENENALKKFDSKRLMNLTRYRNIHYSFKWKDNQEKLHGFQTLDFPCHENFATNIVLGIWC